MDNKPSDLPILAVDLDGTLLRSDMLFESFWSATARDWKTPLLAARTLHDGRAALKRTLGTVSDVDVASLPYDPGVISRIRAWRAEGGRTALVTASDQPIAEMIATHLGLFDEVHGSDGKGNLKGEAKAAFLTDRFGRAGYAYMGDSSADLPVWRNARTAITVNVADTVSRTVDGFGIDVEHMRTAPPAPWLKAMRPHQWMKNILVFLPMLAAQQLNLPTFLQSLLAFVAFSLVASSVYVLNDLLDLAADRAHPRKRNRPLASGLLPIQKGSLMAPGLLAAGFAVSLLLGWQFVLVMLAYYLLTLAYSLGLKRRTVIDISALAALYTMRLVAGATATAIPLSVWMLAFSIFIFFSLAAIKRQAELQDIIDRGHNDVSGRGYRASDLPVISMMAVSSGYVSVLVLALYLNSPAMMEHYSTPELLWGICFVLLYWISRIVMVTHRGHMHDDPVVFATRDRTSRICLIIMVALVILSAVL